MAAQRIGWRTGVAAACRWMGRCCGGQGREGREVVAGRRIGRRAGCRGDGGSEMGFGHLGAVGEGGVRRVSVTQCAEGDVSIYSWAGLWHVGLCPLWADNQLEPNDERFASGSSLAQKFSEQERRLNSAQLKNVTSSNRARSSSVRLTSLELFFPN